MAPGTNSGSTSLELAKRQDAIDVKYKFNASAMSLWAVTSLSSIISLSVSHDAFLFGRTCLRVFQKLRGLNLLSANFSVKQFFLAFLSNEVTRFRRCLYSNQSDCLLNFLAFLWNWSRLLIVDNVVKGFQLMGSSLISWPSVTSFWAGHSLKSGSSREISTVSVFYQRSKGGKKTEGKDHTFDLVYLGL